MITVYHEVTDWGDCPVYNGYYHVNANGDLVGYVGRSGRLKKFKNPMKGFNKARRKFIVVGTYEDEDEDTSGERYEFTGSKGNTYVVTVRDGDATCTCPGFKYRGNCKHYNEVVGS